MKYVNLLCTWPGKGTLPEFAAAFFAAMNINNFQERESENYCDGHYFTGKVGEISFVVAISDEEDNQDLDYWIQASSKFLDDENLIRVVNDAMKNILMPLGMKAARMRNCGKVNEVRIDSA